MSDDALSFLDDQTPEQPEQVEAIAAEPEPVAEVKGEEPAAPPAAVEREQAIPIQALLDERDRRQKAERDAEELRRWRAEQEAKQTRQPPPDIFTDPDLRFQYERQQIQQSLLGVKLEQSRFLAERDFGAETVAEAYAYFDKNPQLSQQLLSHPSPFHAAVDFYKRQKVAEEIGADPDAWRTKQREALAAELREQIRQEVLAEMQPAQTRPRLPGSLAAAPAAGRAGEPRPRGSAFDAAFGS